MSDLPAQVLTAEDIRSVVRSEVGEAIRLALVNVPTIEVIQSMIDAKVNPLREAYEADRRSTDMHLRQAESGLKNTAREIGRKAEQFGEATKQMAEVAAELRATNQERARQIDELQRRFEQHEIIANQDRAELSEVSGQIKNLKTDIHGDPSEPHSMSLYQLITDDRAEAKRQRGENAEKLANIEKKLSEQEEYIASRRGLEKEAMKAVTKLLTNRWVIGILILGLGGILGAEVYMRVIEALLK